MKNIFLLFLMLSITDLSAQKKYTLDNVSTIYMKSSGAIIQKNVVKGYYFLYETDKINRKESKYVVVILDQNLNKVKEIEFEDSKDITISEGSFNGNSFGFVFKNEKKKYVEIRVYDINGLQINTFTRKSESDNDMTKVMVESLTGSSSQELFDVGDMGFAEIFSTVKGFGKTNTDINFVSCRSQQKWTYSLPKTEYGSGVSILGVTDSLLILSVQSRSSLRKMGQFHIEAVKLENGEKSYESNIEDDNFSFYPEKTSAKQSGNNISLIAYYIDKDKAGSYGKTNGIAILTIDNKGKILEKTLNSFDDISKFLPGDGKGKFDELGQLKPHNVLRTNTGKLFIVFEGLDKLLITDMVIMEFNEQNKIANATIFPKVHHKLDDRKEMLNFYENGEVPKFYDYEFTSGESDNSTFFVVYRDYKEKKKKEKDELSYSIIKYSNAKISTDKLKIESEADIIKIFPAKPGSIMVLEYFRKEKRLDIRLEKLG